MTAALVPVDVDQCPTCQAPTITAGVDEPALFAFGGYGATRSTLVRHCTAFCGWWIVQRTGETRPPR